MSMWSSSSSNSVSSSAACLCPPSKTARSMDDIWSGITLSSPHHHRHGSRTLSLQDFLASPSGKPGDGPYEPFSARCGGGSAFGRIAPRPATALSLTRSKPEAGSTNFVSSLEDLSPSGDLFPSFCNNRASENNDNSTNWRHNRMMKNRESAARSRARKQAYANGLENEVARLMEENADLKRQLAKFKAAAAAEVTKKRKSLHRTLTAPF